MNHYELDGNINIPYICNNVKIIASMVIKIIKLILYYF